MFKYFKYYVKKDYKMLLLNILMVIFATNFGVSSYDNYNLIIMLAFANIYVFVFTVYRVLSIINGDLFDGKQFFTYTLPIKKSDILFARCIYALIYSLTIAFSSIGFIVMKFGRIDDLNELLFVLISQQILNISVFCLSYVISKIVFNSKKIGTLIAFPFIMGYYLLQINMLDDMLGSSIITVSVISIFFSLIFFYFSGNLIDNYYEA